MFSDDGDDDGGSGGDDDDNYGNSDDGNSDDGNGDDDVEEEQDNDDDNDLMVMLTITVNLIKFPAVNPLTPKSDQLQISPAASPAILYPTVWRTWLLIAYSDER